MISLFCPRALAPFCMRAANFPQAHVCTLFDVQAKLPVNLAWGPNNSGKRELASLLSGWLDPGDLLLMDSGFAGFAMFYQLLENGIDFVIRLPDDGMLKDIMTFVRENRRDKIMTLSPPQTLRRKQKALGLPVPPPIRLCIVKVRTAKGKSVLLATSLLDKSEIKASDLRRLYRLRWEEEEFFKLIKEFLGAEDFRGKSAPLIDQEIAAVHLYCLLARILIMESALAHGFLPSEIAQQAAFHATSRFLDRLLTARSRSQALALFKDCLAEISWKRYKKRPGRVFPRKSRSRTGKWARK